MIEPVSVWRERIKAVRRLDLEDEGHAHDLMWRVEHSAPTEKALISLNHAAWTDMRTRMPWSNRVFRLSLGITELNVDHIFVALPNLRDVVRCLLAESFKVWIEPTIFDCPLFLYAKRRP